MQIQNVPELANCQVNASEISNVSVCVLPPKTSSKSDASQSTVRLPIEEHSKLNVSLDGPPFLQDKDVAARYGVAAGIIWRWIKDSEAFPKPIKIANGTTRWRLSDLLAFEASLGSDLDLQMLSTSKISSKEKPATLGKRTINRVSSIGKQNKLGTLSHRQKRGH